MRELNTPCGCLWSAFIRCNDAPKGDNEVMEELETNETAIVTSQLRKLLKAKGKGGSKALQSLIGELEGELVTLEAGRDELSIRAAATSLPYVKKRLAELRAAIEGQQLGYGSKRAWEAAY